MRRCRGCRSLISFVKLRPLHHGKPAPVMKVEGTDRDFWVDLSGAETVLVTADGRLIRCAETPAGSLGAYQVTGRPVHYQDRCQRIRRSRSGTASE